MLFTQRIHQDDQQHAICICVVTILAIFQTIDLAEYVTQRRRSEIKMYSDGDSSFISLSRRLYLMQQETYFKAIILHMAH